jgi:hypothetical protein
MTSIKMMGAGLLALAALVAAGCGDPGKKDGGKDGTKDGTKAGGKDGKKEEALAGPHKGPIAEWGEEEYHVEFTVDHPSKTVKVYVYGPDHKTFKAAPIKTDKVLLSVKKPAFQVELKPERQKDDPEGTASVFVGKDDRFGVEQEFEGVLSAKVGGKDYSGDFKEKAEHVHKDKKK